MRLFTWPYNPKQPFWLDLFPSLCVANFASLVTYGVYAPGGRKTCALIDEKISAPKILRFLLPIDRPTSFVWNVGLWAKQRTKFIRCWYWCGWPLAKETSLYLYQKSKSYMSRCTWCNIKQHNKRTQKFLLYCFTSLLQIQIIKERRSRRDVWLVPELKHP